MGEAGQASEAGVAKADAGVENSEAGDEAVNEKINLGKGWELELIGPIKRLTCTHFHARADGKIVADMDGDVYSKLAHACNCHHNRKDVVPDANAP